MRALSDSRPAGVAPAWFNWLKYLVYGLLALNVLLFLREEWLASGHVFVSAVPLLEIISTFSATIDTAAWVLLLLMFELETYQIPDQRLTPPVIRTLHGLRLVSYAVILYACYGYLATALGLYGFGPAEASDLCAAVGSASSVLVNLDKYQLLDAGNCNALAGSGVLLTSADGRILVDSTVLAAVQRLAWVDVINASTWILVVALLELDVRLQEHERLIGFWVKASFALKVLFYAVLFAAAVYWGVAGDFLDFWDALLWLLAFFCVELNVFEWRAEVHGTARAVA